MGVVQVWRTGDQQLARPGEKYVIILPMDQVSSYIPSQMLSNRLFPYTTTVFTIPLMNISVTASNTVAFISRPVNVLVHISYHALKKSHIVLIYFIYSLCFINE
jgi:hypothetical protein